MVHPNLRGTARGSPVRRTIVEVMLDTAEDSTTASLVSVFSMARTGDAPESEDELSDPVFGICFAFDRTFPRFFPSMTCFRMNLRVFGLGFSTLVDTRNGNPAITRKSHVRRQNQSVKATTLDARSPRGFAVAISC